MSSFFTLRGDFANRSQLESWGEERVDQLSTHAPASSGTYALLEQSGDEYSASAEIRWQGSLLLAHSVDKDPKQALLMALDKVERRLLKWKDCQAPAAE